MTIQNGPLSLRQIHDAVIFKAISGGFLGPLRLFLKNIEMEWGPCGTACAFRREGVAIVRLSPDFVAENALTVNETADVVHHEIMHHLLRHFIAGVSLGEQGFSHALQNLAMDAIINAHLHSVGCAKFMERYYPDERELAFLRPNSRNFAITCGFIFKRMKPVGEVDTSKSKKFYDFYRKLYALEIGLDKALKFFQEHFPEPTSESNLLGNHGAVNEEKPEQVNKQKVDESDSSDNHGNVDKSEQEKVDQQEGGLFDPVEAREILEALKIVPAEVSKETSNNFAEIIGRVASVLNQQGPSRADKRQSRRFPAKLNRQDVLNIERDRMLFQRHDYRLKEVIICPDISGSMEEYIPFIIGLIQKLQTANVRVRVVCWAGSTLEVPLREILQGNLPDTIDISNTNGESLVQFLECERIAHAVVITDNCAGQIHTRVNTQIHLCLVEGSDESGSFLNREVVPKCKLHHLTLMNDKYE
jgi:predicted metal-dependent peptidase